jgi:hypothetical protein
MTSARRNSKDRSDKRVIGGLSGGRFSPNRGATLIPNNVAGNLQ